MANVYEPGEDSALLQKAIRDFFITHPGIQVTNALDMGTGSGILAVTLCNYCRDVLAVDINPEAIEATVRYAKSNHVQNLTVTISDLFNTIHGTFDIITFNPPYLPFDPEQDAEDIALSPKETVADEDIKAPVHMKGNELIIRFVKHAKAHLNPNGNILLLFSSLSSPEDIFKACNDEGFSNELITSEKHAFEELFVYRLWVKR